MIGQIIDLVGDRRDEMIFIPMAIFTYIFITDELYICEYNPLNFNYVYTGMSESVYFFAALCSAIATSIVYDFIRTLSGTESFSEYENKIQSGTLPVIIILSSVFGFLIFSLWSAIELVVRLCTNDPILFGILLLFVIILTSSFSGAYLRN